MPDTVQTYESKGAFNFPIPSGLTYVPQSFKRDGITVPDEQLSITSSVIKINDSTLTSNTSYEFTYDTKVTESSSAVLKSTLSFIDSFNNDVTTSNQIAISTREVEISKGDVTKNQQINSSELLWGSNITYTIDITNNEAKNSDQVWKDVIDTEVDFDPATAVVALNGAVQYNETTRKLSISIGDIAPLTENSNNKKQVIFSVKPIKHR